MLNAMHEKNGWLLNNTMIAKATPNGLSELMVVNGYANHCGIRVP
jgi:hypothetical protein